MSTVYVGVDVARQTVEAALWLPGAAQGEAAGQFANDDQGFEALAAQVQRLAAPHDGATVQVVMEPTGGYELALRVFAYQQGWLVSLPNPKTVRQWGQGMGRRAKTDRQDALLLAHYGAACRPPALSLLPAAVEELDSLLERREDLKKALRGERNRLDALQQRPAGPWRPAAVVGSIQRVIDQLEQEAAAIEQAIKQLLDENPELADKAQQLRTVPGVGAVNSLPLLVLLARWQHLTHGAGLAGGLTAFVGLDPRLHESGQSVRRRPTISRQGDATIRYLLFMGALGGVRGRNPLRCFYQRLVSRGKAKRLALVAASRKILVWAWAVFQSDQPFDPTRFAHLA
jgi:transposase